MKHELMQQPTIGAQLSASVKSEQENNQRMLLKQLSSLRYLLRQGYNEQESNLVQLLLLRSEDCNGLKAWLDGKKYLSHEIVNEMVRLMSNHVLREILGEIREALYFSLIADEASDVKHCEQLCVSIRWVDENFAIHEDPLELIHVPKTDSSTLVTCIKDCLVRFALPLSQCKGQAYDGAANMSGHRQGVAARLQQEQPTALYVHCLAHCTNLSLRTVGRQSMCIRDALDLVMGLSQLIQWSPKRTSLFQTLQQQLSPGAPTLKPLCPTRWTVRTGAIDSVLNNYDVLCSALEEIHAAGSDEYAIKAAGFLSLMEKFALFFGLKLSHLIFSAMEQLSITLQGKDTTIQESVQAAKLALRYLEMQRDEDKFDAFYTKVTEESKNLTSEPALPRYRKRPRRLDDGQSTHRFDDPKTTFRQQYYEAIDLVHGDLERRFCQERGMPVAAVLETLLLNTANGISEGDDYPDELKLYSTDLSVEQLLIQLKLFPDLKRMYNEKNPCTPLKEVTSLRTICEMMNDLSFSKRMFSEVYKLLRILLTVPVTTSTAERTFSVLRRLKTYLRSSMAQPRLNHMLLLHVHKDRTDNIDLVKIAKEFAAVNERRKKFLGAF